MLEFLAYTFSYLLYMFVVLSVIAIVLGLGLFLAHVHEVKLIREGRERLAELRKDVE